MQYVIYIAAGIVLLGLCIFIHELGHLLGGMMVGIKAKTFSIGMGKGIVKKKIGDTTFQIAPFPFGGYCQFYGEDPSEERTGQGFEFLSAHPLKRIVTVAMGPLFNLFFGIIIFFVMNLVGYSKDTNQVYIPEQMQSGKNVSAAYAAGLRSNDWIVKIGPEDVHSFADISAAVMFSEGKKLDVTVKRDGKELVLPVTPKKNEGSGRFEIGVMPHGSRILIVELVEDGAARAAGLREMDEIVSMDGKPVASEAEFSKYVNGHADRTVRFKVVRKGKEFEKDIVPRLNDVVRFRPVDEKGNKGKTISIMKSKNLQKYLDKGSIMINGRKILTYEGLIGTVKEVEGKQISFQIDKEQYRGTAETDKVGLIGIFQAVAPDQVHVRYGISQAFVQSFVEPYKWIVLNLKGLGMLFTGRMNVRENLSGPIRIVQIAGQVAYYKGMSDFILLMAKISIILMVMNLLPIPVVDGSHLIFFTIEMIRRKPMSQKVMERIQTVGIVILALIMGFAIFNDISMLPFIQNFFK
ncbi:MAG: site-2 protease family protein [Spirochaetes bacterium]|nr:site-2 protease family protein [Spirochaetota bacterium]